MLRIRRPDAWLSDIESLGSSFFMGPRMLPHSDPPLPVDQAPRDGDTGGADDLGECAWTHDLRGVSPA
jgi:hypothetical protein